MNKTRVETREFEEKTVDKAIEAACNYFGCAEEDLDIEIITRGSTGLFGLGGKKAKIKVTFKSPEGKQALESGAGEMEAEKEGPSVVTESEPEESATKATEADQEEESQAQPSYVEKPQAQEELSREAIEQRVALARDITNEILEKSGLSGHADVMEQTARPFVNITGDDLSLIIGKEGQTLDALEYIVNLCLRRRDPDVNYRVMLEAAGYRERRKKSLVSMAERLAIKVKRTGRPVSLQPMPARERRIVHMALKEFKGVKTHSSGQGPNRKVVITPLRKKRHQRRQRAKEQ